MNAEELELSLRSAASRWQWVDALARFFAAGDLFFGHGADCAEDEAYWLVWHLSGAPADLADIPVDASTIESMVGIARRRVEQRLPLAYLTGSAWFAGLEFEVGPEVLVPRSPLAELIERGFAPWSSPGPGDRILEIGTGSACIAVAAARYCPEVKIDATEIDAAALRIASANVARHRVGDRVRLCESDLFPDGDHRYRVIISNPPYVPTRDIGRLPAEYGHEPRAALDGGMDGLDVVRRILDGAGSRLAEDGILVVEVGQAAEALLAAWPGIPWTWLEFERGGDGVFLLTAKEVENGWG